MLLKECKKKDGIHSLTFKTGTRSPVSYKQGYHCSEGILSKFI